MNTTTKAKNKRDSLYKYTFFFLFFLELLLAFSFFGYVVTDNVSLTSMHIPVLIGAFLLGPIEGLFLGGIFGLTSMWKANTTAKSYADIIFSPFISGKLIPSIILCLVTRMLFGLIAGLLYKFVEKKISHKKTGIMITTIVSVFIHSFLVYGAMGIFFPKTNFSIISPITQLNVYNLLLDKGLTVLIMLFIYWINNSKQVMEFKQNINNLEKKNHIPTFNGSTFIFIFIIFTLVVSLLFHFYTRVEDLFYIQNIHMSETILSKFHQIGLQFIVAIFSFCGLITIVLKIFQLYTLEMKYKSDHDLMTGLYNKTYIIEETKKILGQQQRNHFGTFIILDLDNFKYVNDTFGHPIGDQLLIKVADILTSSTTKQDLVARFGGDEFCIYCPETNSLEQICFMVNNISKKIKDMELKNLENKNLNVTCSIGISISQHSISFEELYKQADSVLYCSKKHGKNQYMIYQYSTIPKT